jgi:DnaJ family protein A protein 2
MGDLFEMFAGGGRRQPRGPPKGENVQHRLKCSLEDMYKGTTRKIALTRQAQCTTCRGGGTKSGRKYPCEVCRGTGVKVMMRPLGPGMMQQIQQPCDHCKQTGYAPPSHDLCKECSGKGLVPEKKVFEIHVEQGHKHASKIVLRGEAGYTEAGVEPGDVVFNLEQKQHKLFRRIHSDLVYEKEITLTEALCGTSFTIKHLDDRILKVTSAPGEVITPDSWKCIQDEGMPEHGRPYEHGNMYIQFHVKFPETLSPQQVAALQQTLGGSTVSTPGSPGAQNPTSNGDVDMADGEHIEEVSFRSVQDIEEELRSRRQYAKDRGAEAYDSSDDEDGGRGGQRVQCAQQ